MEKSKNTAAEAIDELTWFLSEGYVQDGVHRSVVVNEQLPAWCIRNQAKAAEWGRDE